MKEALTTCFNFIATGLLEALSQARNHGLLDALQETPGTAAEYASKLGIDQRATELVLDVLRSLGYVELDGDRYRWMKAESMAQPWEHIGGFLRTGRSLPFIDEADQRGAYYYAAVPELGRAFEHAAQRLAEQFEPAQCILDVGAGSGVWSLAMAGQAPDTRVIAIDLEQVIPRFLEAAVGGGMRDRVEVIVGDYNEVLPTHSVDRILLAHVLHLETPANAAALIQRFASVLSPGGQLIIVDFFRGESSLWDLPRSIYSLHLGVRTARGRVYSVDELTEWCAAAGLNGARCLAFDELMQTVAFSGMGALSCTRPPTSPAEWQPGMRT